MGRNSPVIVVVDDDEKSRSLIEGVFEPIGYQIIECEDGYSLLDLLQSLKPDIILLDVMMPGLSGFDVCRKIKEDPKLEDVPIIFLTARSDSEGLVEAFDIGAVDYLQKPFNISELVARVQHHINFKWAHEELKVANSIRDKFFLIISHDLKNPFNSILMNSNLLKNRYQNLDEEMKQQLVDGIQTSVEHTYNLLENLLEWSKKQLGKIDVVKETLDIHKISVEAVGLVSGQAGDKGIELINEIPSETTAFADSYMITLVLRNLLSNAIKFSHPNSKVRLSCETNEGMLEISIIDYGVGISEEDLQRLFKLDVHHTTYGTNNEKGAGLGLILAQEFINDNSGSIRVTSTPGELTEFTVSLPLSG